MGSRRGPCRSWPFTAILIPMGYRHPTRQPGHEVAESERRIDDHMAAAARRRVDRLRRLRRLDQALAAGRWLIAGGALAVGTSGVFADSQAVRVRSLCLFAVVLFWWLLRLVARIWGISSR